MTRSNSVFVTALQPKKASRFFEPLGATWNPDTGRIDVTGTLVGATDATWVGLFGRTVRIHMILPNGIETFTTATTGTGGVFNASIVVQPDQYGQWELWAEWDGDAQYEGCE